MKKYIKFSKILKYLGIVICTIGVLLGSLICSSTLYTENYSYHPDLALGITIITASLVVGFIFVGLYISLSCCFNMSKINDDLKKDVKRIEEKLLEKDKLQK